MTYKFLSAFVSLVIILLLHFCKTFCKPFDNLVTTETRTQDFDYKKISYNLPYSFTRKTRS